MAEELRETGAVDAAVRLVSVRPEAAMSAIRLARGAAGAARARSKIIKSRAATTACG